ncbi:DUF6542 domain-containing protein [Prauserella aidingensis]|uniref:DUF6542 domain-containing protein n=1 Tax=Prauserella aidingensis TaxID=387890 RepID=UPI0020A4A35C|nr:DUF6542 domain-containing protein [Prauserella aidingensis]
MTATRDRRSDPDAANEDEPVPWDERLVFGARRGLPWWGAVLLALVTAIAGAVLSTQVTDGLGLPFQLIYVAGALAAVAAVRRRNLFGPMVQPPLVMAVVVPLVVLTGTSLPESNDMLADVLAVSTPLINNFPVMAIATALTVALGVFRIYRERDPDRPVKDTSKRTRSRDSGAGDERPAAAKEKRPAKGAKGKAPEDPVADSDAAAGAGRPAGDSGTSGRPRKPRPPEDRPDGAPSRGEPGRGEPGRGEPGRGEPGRSEPQRRGRPADGPPGRGPRGPEDAPPRRPRPADQDRGSRTPPPAERRPPRPPRTPPPDAGPAPKRPQRPPRGERPEPPERPKRPRGAEPPPGRDRQPRRPWDGED